MKIEIVSDAGAVRVLDLVRFDGDQKPLAVVRWGMAGTYEIDLTANCLRHARGVVVTNWRAVDVGALLEQHAAWRRRRRELAKPAIIRGRR